jgi:hypothetical protein
MARPVEATTEVDAAEEQDRPERPSSLSFTYLSFQRNKEAMHQRTSKDQRVSS